MCTKKKNNFFKISRYMRVLKVYLYIEFYVFCLAFVGFPHINADYSRKGVLIITFPSNVAMTCSTNFSFSK